MDGLRHGVSDGGSGNLDGLSNRVGHNWGRLGNGDSIRSCDVLNGVDLNKSVNKKLNIRSV
jgi:hypothetical protein